MSNSFQQSFSSSNNHPPKDSFIQLSQHGNSSVTLNVTESNFSLLPASVSTTKDRFLCTICVDSPDSPLDVAVLPACNHSFCLSCLASWSTVRQVCPNCKTRFVTASLRRDLDSHPVQGPPTKDGVHPMLEHPVDAICQASWITLHEIHSPKHDIEASFSLPPRDLLAAINADDVNTRSASSSSAVPYFVHEDYEDELEDRIWQEEEYHHERLLRRARTVSNRRYGPSGYISAGRMRATPRPNQSQPGSSSSHAVQSEPKPKANNMIKSPQAKTTRSSPNILMNPTPGVSNNSLSQSSNTASSGGRKKKMKKNSRAGVAAAKAAAEKAATEERKKKSFQSSRANQQIESALEQVAIGNTSASQVDEQPDDVVAS